MSHSLAPSRALLGVDSGIADERMVAVLDAYVAALEAGEAEPIEVVAARHPELGDELRACLAGVRTIHDVVHAVESAGVDPDGPLSPIAPLTEPDDVPLAEALTVDGPHGVRPSGGGAAPVQRVLGDYRIVREIGRGGMGVVYEAEEQALRRRVALKVLPFAAVLDQRQIARFRNEAQAAAGLHHAHIVPVFSIGHERGVHYYAMQYIEGQSLAEAIAGLRDRAAAPAAGSAAQSPAQPAPSAPAVTTSLDGRTSRDATLGETNRSEAFFRAAAKIACDAADALHHAHELGVVHRDVKPSNLLLDQQGAVWITDFGLARMQTELGVTATGDVVGTLRYMSPEQASGRADRVDGRTDVYGLGATLYELLTLEHAHRGDTRQELLAHLERSEPIAPRRHNPAIPADLENIVLRAMERDRESRYASAAELRDDLTRYLDGRPTIARPPTIAQRVSKWTRRHRRLVATAAAALAVVAVVATVSGVVVDRARARAEAALADSEANRARAERLLDHSVGVLERLGGDLSDRLAVLPGSEAIRQEALANTFGYYEAFLREAVDDPRLTASAAQTRVRAAAVAERLGRPGEALRLYDEAQTTLDRLVTDRPDDRDARSWLASCLVNRGLLERQAGDADAARVRLDRAVALRRATLNESPGDPAAMAALSRTLSERASLARSATSADRLLTEAIRLADRARAAAPTESRHGRDLAVAHSTLASRLRMLDPDRAASSCNTAIELLTRLVQSEPTVADYRADLALAYSNRGALAADRGAWDSSALAYREAAHELATLARDAPAVPRHRTELAVALASAGLALARDGQRDAADEAFDSAALTLRRLAAANPRDGKYQRSLAALWNNRGVALRDTGRLEEAADAFARSVRIEEARLGDAPATRPTLLDVHYENQAQVLGRLGRFDEAAAIETKRVALLKRSGATATDDRTSDGPSPQAEP